jgi:hypothetical protein
MANHLQPTGLPSHGAVPEGPRRVCHRQVVRDRHDLLSGALARRGFIAWMRPPGRLSRHPVSVRTGHCQAPVGVAGLTDTGRAAPGGLTGPEQPGPWIAIRARPHGLHHPSNAS